jgi:hypothetical protein
MDGKCRLLLVMASCSKGQLGALNAKGYDEKCNSAGKLVLTEENSFLSDDKIGMLVMLRMNKEFMVHMRNNYPNVVQELFGRTLVTNTHDPIINALK